MKPTDNFKTTIKAYLEDRASKDPLFAKSYAKEKKNINDCCTYIINWVKASGCNGFCDDEIYGQAVHYYDEDNIKIGNPIRATIVVNHSFEAYASGEKKESAKLISQAKKIKPAEKTTKQNNSEQSLFGQTLSLFE